MSERERAKSINSKPLKMFTVHTYLKVISFLCITFLHERAIDMKYTYVHNLSTYSFGKVTTVKRENCPAIWIEIFTYHTDTKRLFIL